MLSPCHSWRLENGGCYYYEDCFLGWNSGGFLLSCGGHCRSSRGTFLLWNLRVSHISHHTEPGLRFQDPAHFLLSIRMFWGTISEFKVALYPLVPPTSHAVCIWGPAKLVAFESKTVAFSYCLPCCSPGYLEFLLKIIEAENLLHSPVPASETRIASASLR